MLVFSICGEIIEGADVPDQGSCYSSLEYISMHIKGIASWGLPAPV